MVTVIKAQRNSRSGGLALVFSSILLAAGNTLLITIHRVGGTSRNIEAYAQGIENYLGLWQLTHTLLTLAPIVWMLGFIPLFRTLWKSGERRVSLFALVALSLGSISHIISAVDGGFVLPALAQNYLTASDTARETAAAVLDHNRTFSLVLMTISIFHEMLSIGLFGFSLIRAKLYNKWLAWAGVAIGAFGIAGYSMGIFGPYWISSPLFLPLGAASTVWIIALGIALYRKNE